MTIPAVLGISGYREMAQMAALQGQPQQVKEEFMAIFYREILKQAFQSPNFNLADQDEDRGGFASTFTSDLLVSKMAEQLAKSQAFALDQVFPQAASKETGDK